MIIVNSNIFTKPIHPFLEERNLFFKRSLYHYFVKNNFEEKDDFQQLIDSFKEKHIIVAKKSEKLSFENYCLNQYVYFKHEILQNPEYLIYRPYSSEETFRSSIKTQLTTDVASGKDCLTFSVSHSSYHYEDVFNCYLEELKMVFSCIRKVNSQIDGFNDSLQRFKDEHFQYHKNGYKNVQNFIDGLNLCIESTEKYL